MASGSFTGTTSNTYITPRITWSSTATTSTNKSSLTVRFQLKKSSSSNSSTYGTGSWTLTIGGNSYSFSKVVTIKTNDTYMDIYSKTVTIAHDDDGSKSIAIKVTGGIPDTTYTSTTLSKTVTLDTIPRSSSFSVPSSVNTGSKLVVSITPSSSTFRHRFKFVINGTTQYTSGYVAAGTNSYSYTIPHSWLPKTTSQKIALYCYTYPASGDTAIASVQKTFTANVPSSIKPTVSKVATALVSGLDGKYVQGKSKVTLTATATAGSGSTISAYIFKGANINGTSSSYTGTSNAKTSSVIQSSGKVTYIVRAKDARGRESDDYTISINVCAYAAPQISSIKAQRCLKDGTLDNDGTYAKVTVKVAYSPIDGVNTRTIALANKLKDATSYGTSTTVSDASETSTTYTGVYGGSFDTDTSYEIQAVITDRYSNHKKSVTLKVAQRTINIARYGNGVAIGGLSTVDSSSASGKFECNWDTNINAKLDVAGNITTSGDFGCSEAYNGSNFAMYCQWKDASNHDILVRSSDGLTMGLGWKGNDNYPTVLDIRPTQVNIRGKTTVQGFRIPEIQRGTVTVTPSAANTPTSKAVVFSQEFSGTPTVIVSTRSTVVGTIVLGVATNGATSTGVNVWVTRTNTTDTSVNWLAVY